jgi:uncharacterized membrane protein YeaQ/YmgE (transglycosylase-associated protein family)
MNFIFELVAWIVLGGIAGWMASAFLGSRLKPIANILLGIAGALVGGLITRILVGQPLGLEFNLTTLIIAFFGAVIVLGSVNWLRSRG